MSDERGAETAGEDRSEPVRPSETASPPPAPEARSAPPPVRHGGAAARGVVLVLLVLIAGAATSPWWAPGLARLLPWGTTEVADTAARARLEALDQRLAALEQ